ncbi:hypothetical protein CATRI_12470 [Corynebacterium atrinae]|uniref:three-helix bundle dimerization domain-containing protein n=1 Tax=Corynebacterium atrinae TaxID=1336740 RepID=UPI0025B60D14|nr:hypothetical protein [Corynebacterium atrinae]WJY64542.1 hypothetical protein CATRI_12470 [Corynebacterium atrinae]
MNNNSFFLVRRDLYTRYGHACDARIIDSILDKVITRHTATAKVTDFLPIFIARDAAEQIEDHAWTHGDVGTPRKKILFVNRSNAPVAVLAAGLARRLSNNGVVATTAATHPENREDNLIEWVISERGLAGAAVSAHDRTLDAPDLVVYLGMDEDADLPGRRYVHWDVSHTDGMDLTATRQFADELEGAVARLLQDLDIRPLAQDAEPLAA